MNVLRLGAKARQFWLLVLVNAFVGGMIGMERSILPGIAEHEFRLTARTAIFSFILVFGMTKAITNYFAGRLSDQFGRKRVLVAGWLVALPTPLLLMWAPAWRWVLLANALLGISQGLAWSATVVMKIDLVGSERRGLAMGLNEFAGYVAVAAAALATGWIADHYGVRPEPFYLGILLAVSGFLLSAFVVGETKPVRLHPVAPPSTYEVLAQTSFRDPNLSSVSQAGFVNNLNDGMAWGLFPLFFAGAGMSISQIGVLAAIYPATWGFVQLLTGALSDRIGRKWLIVAGMWVQAFGIGMVTISSVFYSFAIGSALLGIGTAMVYPTLLAAVGDVVDSSYRASSLGVYRLWRDLGYAVGALVAGVSADALGFSGAMWLVASLTFLSGVLAAIRMTETLHFGNQERSKSVWLLPVQ